MANTSLLKDEMPHQDANLRRNNWEEVALGYSYETAIDEAKRCLNCKHKPCVGGCPVSVDIPGFISKLLEDDLDGANELIKRTNTLPAVCGRVCPQEIQCEAKCVRGVKGEPVAIGRLERFVADNAGEPSKANNIISEESFKKRVAVIGSGPAGLTCAGSLSNMGYDVTIFEALHTPGGVLVYGIPEFRLPKSIVKKEIDLLIESGVKIELNKVIGRIKTIEELFSEGYEAVFISTGAGLPQFMGIDGEDAIGVYSANEFLTRVNLMKAYDERYITPVNIGNRVAVIGGGNVAMDSARCAKRFGVDEVMIIYRRSEDEMPARREEIEHAKEEGIKFLVLTNPTKIISDTNGLITSIECVRMELGEPDESGRRRPNVVKGSEFTMKMDNVIMAIGTSPNPLLSEITPGLDVDRRGCIVTDENMRTSMKGVWAGGDAVTGSATVILAMGAGRTAAADIDRYLKSK
ncbi:MAG: NADPH-dependent glutamate synthase [Ruminococcaceae bacterium]|nr:NADPH-dependent glutamate synthase [Oscillospiraceae bacterium]